MITVDGVKVTITEVDAWGRNLTWVYDGKSYIRTASPSAEHGTGEHIRSVSEGVFALAYWRNWNADRSK